MKEIDKNFKNETITMKIPVELNDNLIKKANRKNISLSDSIHEIFDNF